MEEGGGRQSTTQALPPWLAPRKAEDWKRASGCGMGEGGQIGSQREKPQGEVRRNSHPLHTHTRLQHHEHLRMQNGAEAQEGTRNKAQKAHTPTPPT